MKSNGSKTVASQASDILTSDKSYLMIKVKIVKYRFQGTFYCPKSSKKCVSTLSTFYSQKITIKCGFNHTFYYFPYYEKEWCPVTIFLYNSKHTIA